MSDWFEESLRSALGFGLKALAGAAALVLGIALAGVLIGVGVWAALAVLRALGIFHG